MFRKTLWWVSKIMKMKKILNEWKVFLKENESEVFKKQIQKMKPSATPYDVAAYFILLAIQGNNSPGVKKYFEVVENHDYIFNVLDNEQKYFNLIKTGQLDFLRKKTDQVLVVQLKDPEMTLKNPPQFNSVDEYDHFMDVLDSKITAQNYDFSEFKSQPDTFRTKTFQPRHSGGASDVGIEIPPQASEKDREYIGTRLKKWLNTFFTPPDKNTELEKYKAEEGFLQALERVIQIYDKYPKQKDKYYKDLVSSFNELSNNFKKLEVPKKDADPDELLSQAEAGDKEAAALAYNLFRSMGPTYKLQARKARMLMR